MITIYWLDPIARTYLLNTIVSSPSAVEKGGNLSTKPLGMFKIDVVIYIVNTQCILTCQLFNY